MAATVVSQLQDPALPCLGDALDPRVATRALRQAPRFAEAGLVTVTRAALTRHKVGRRCLIEYDIDVTWRDGQHELLAAIGKMRARHEPGAAARRLSAFWHAGFSDTSADGISVPESLGPVPGLDLWLQRKVPGVPATDLLSTAAGPALAPRIAAAARKVHRSGVRTRREHSVDREMEILATVLSHVADRPGWSRRIGTLLTRCARAARDVGAQASDVVGIHRDFYADQVLVQGDRLYLLDFDLYCHGPIGLDLGNFIGHVAEHAVRAPERAAHLHAVDAALQAAVVEHEGVRRLAEVRAFAALTLARHAYLSATFPDREPWADAVLHAALERLEPWSHD